MQFAKKGKDSNRQDKKKAQEKAKVKEEFEGQDTDTIKDDFEDALQVSNERLESVVVLRPRSAI